MKKFKRFISMALCMILCFTMFNFNVEAAEVEYKVGDIVDGSELIDDTQSTGKVEHIARGVNLGDGVSGIANCGNGLVYASGSTNCNRVCSQVNLTLYVERLVNGDWIRVSERSFSTNNSYDLNGSYYVTVTKGYFYRVQGYHTASSNGITESNWSKTGGVWVG